VTPSGSDPLDGLPLADLRCVVSALVAQLATLQESVDRLTIQNAALQAENIALKDEIARLKGLPPRPKFKVKPSGVHGGDKPGHWIVGDVPMRAV
jgi:hypothetical protein